MRYEAAPVKLSSLPLTTALSFPPFLPSSFLCSLCHLWLEFEFQQQPTTNIDKKRHILLMGQTPPPWHGQAVATALLFDHDWPGWEVHRLRMGYSEEMVEVGRFQWRKLGHLWQLIRRARRILRENPGTILLYPPASAKWIPFLRDVLFLLAVRSRAHGTVFIYHAAGLAKFAHRGWVRRVLANRAYGGAEVALEVAVEDVRPGEVFFAREGMWCPCAIEVPEWVAAEGKAALGRELKAGSQRPLSALFVGSLQEGKGVLEIMRTAAALRRNGRGEEWRFRIVGKWYSEEFRREAERVRRELGVEDCVELVGELTGDDKWRAYAEADAFFFPTHYASEMTPIVLMEALGAGLPVVTTRWSGIPAMLEGCASARLCEVRQPEGFAAALSVLQGEIRNGVDHGAASREYYLENYQPERFIGRVDAALQRAGRRADARDDPARRRLWVYFADQNPGFDRSIGISRMSEAVLRALAPAPGMDIEVLSSETALRGDAESGGQSVVPWSTRNRVLRLLTDHLHPLWLRKRARKGDVYYYPKGYLPVTSGLLKPSVVTIHDTIIHYYQKHHPTWRRRFEYAYWSRMLRGTLRRADVILTVSESSARAIREFMEEKGMPAKVVVVTHEPCFYEDVPQPEAPEKGDYVLHFASREPHKRTHWLMNWWQAESERRELPLLHLIGSMPPDASALAWENPLFHRHGYVEDDELVGLISGARAVILPSEIEGFGLPALEAYYLGTPVCFTSGIAVEEVLAPATSKGGFLHEGSPGLGEALEEVMAMSPEEIRECGLRLRKEYAASKVAEKMMEVFR